MVVFGLCWIVLLVCLYLGKVGVDVWCGDVGLLVGGGYFVLY